MPRALLVLLALRPHHSMRCMRHHGTGSARSSRRTAQSAAPACCDVLPVRAAVRSASMGRSWLILRCGASEEAVREHLAAGAAALGLDQLHTAELRCCPVAAPAATAQRPV